MFNIHVCRYDTTLADASAALADKWATVEVCHSRVCMYKHEVEKHGACCSFDSLY